MDRITPEKRSAVMARIRSKDTKPELAVRRAAHRLGYRFRLHRKDLRGRPDLVFPSRQCVIFVHGCFWHNHPDPNCSAAGLPKTRLDYWGPKLARNIERDGHNVEILKAAGWRVLILWECQIKQPDLDQKLVGFLGPIQRVTSSRRPSPERP